MQTSPFYSNFYHFFFLRSEDFCPLSFSDKKCGDYGSPIEWFSVKCLELMQKFHLTAVCIWSNIQTSLWSTCCQTMINQARPPPYNPTWIGIHYNLTLIQLVLCSKIEPQKTSTNPSWIVWVTHDKNSTKNSDKYLSIHEWNVRSYYSPGVC